MGQFYPKELLVCILVHHTVIGRIGRVFVARATYLILASDIAYPVCSSSTARAGGTPADVTEVVVLLFALPYSHFPDQIFWRNIFIRRSLVFRRR